MTFCRELETFNNYALLRKNFTSKTCSRKFFHFSHICYIDADEIRDIVIGLFRLAGIEEDEDLVLACVSDVKDAVDQDGDGDITKDEFVKNAMQSKFIFNMLKG